MKFNELSLENFGIYSGINTFKLNNSKDKNIILICGKNGNGKTTFFDSIRLCLYGQRFLGKSLTKKNYIHYLKNKIHYNSNNQFQKIHAKVSVEFEHTTNDETCTYLVSRYWKNDNNDIKEKFEVKRDGTLIEDFDEQEWEDFIDELIPKGLTDIFFFDGEKIQNLAEDKTDNKELANSFKSLFGIDIIEKLIRDLDLYGNRELRNLKDDDVSNQVNEIETGLKELENKIETYMQEKAAILNSEESLLKEISQVENKLKKEGGNFSLKRDKLKEDLNINEAKINELENNIKSYCLSNLPFLFSSNLNNNLVETIRNEKEIKTKNIIDELLNTKLLNVENKLNEMFKEHKIKNIDKEISQVIKDEFNTKEGNSSELIHDLSTYDEEVILSIFKDVNSNAKSLLFDNVKGHNKITKELETIQRELSFAPKDDVIKPYLDKLNIKNQKLGSTRNKILVFDEKIQTCQIQEQNLIKGLSKLKDFNKEKSKIAEKLQNIEKAQKVLKDYYEKVKEEKIKEFSIIFIDIFNSLLRKNNLFQKIYVDPTDFSVTLYKDDKYKISKSKLSQGEKQMFAIAVIWTLTKQSKREIPFIIDTPMGRLDSTHRDNLVQKFFPNVSKQLIILSTDTEIDTNYYNYLKPNISKSYLLNENEGSTKISEGYFE